MEDKRQGPAGAITEGENGAKIVNRTAQGKFAIGNRMNPGGLTKEIGALRMASMGLAAGELEKSFATIFYLRDNAEDEKVRLSAASKIVDIFIPRASSFVDEDGKPMDAGAQAEMMMVLVRKVLSNT